MLTSMLRRCALALCSLGSSVAMGCAADPAPPRPTSPAVRPASALDFPFVYIGSGTRPAAIEPLVALDAARPEPVGPATMGCALWFGRDVPPELRTTLERRLPAALAARAVWGDRFVYLSAVADLDERLGEEGVRALAEDLDAWIMDAHGIEPLVFAIREGVGASTDPRSWHRQSMLAVEDRVIPVLEGWLSANPPATAGPRGPAVAKLVRTLLRFVDAHQERWIRAYGDERWFHLVERSLGHDVATDIETAGAVLDADLPLPREQPLAFRAALHLALAVRGRPSIDGRSSARLLAEVARVQALPDPWVGEAVGRMAHAVAWSRGPEAAAIIGETCLTVSACPPSTAADAARWWLDAGRMDQARAVVEHGEQRWPEHPAWAELGARLERGGDPPAIAEPPP
jgi:hypothetical protein